MCNRYLLVLSVLLLGGCANFGFIPRLQHQDGALAIASKLTSPDITQTQQANLVEDVNTRYSEDPSAEHLLALALVYAVPNQPQSSLAKALTLLDKLDTSKLTPGSRYLAKWLSSDLAYRDSLERSNTKLGSQVADMAAMKAALAQARNKIEILTRIEQTIGPTPQLDQSPGEPKH